MRARLALFVVAALLVASCGQKGPLYRPEASEAETEENND